MDAQAQVRNPILNPILAALESHIEGIVKRVLAAQPQVNYTDLTVRIDDAVRAEVLNTNPLAPSFNRVAVQQMIDTSLEVEKLDILATLDERLEACVTQLPTRVWVRDQIDSRANQHASSYDHNELMTKDDLEIAMTNDLETKVKEIVENLNFNLSVS